MFQSNIQEKKKKLATEEVPLNDDQVIQDLDQGQSYKYLGIEDGGGVHHCIKVKIKKEHK